MIFLRAIFYRLFKAKENLPLLLKRKISQWYPAIENWSSPCAMVATACMSGYTARSPRNQDLQQNAAKRYWFGWECLEEEKGSRKNRHGDQITNALSYTLHGATKNLKWKNSVRVSPGQRWPEGWDLINHPLVWARREPSPPQTC